LKIPEFEKPRYSVSQIDWHKDPSALGSTVKKQNQGIQSNSELQSLTFPLTAVNSDANATHGPPASDRLTRFSKMYCKRFCLLAALAQRQNGSPKKAEA
jgi:hypothetical protein